ncbi:MAG: 50S ribosomal protein L15 [Candidatus Pacebacteria bacterium CG10_big_fil_rev_8_21_14_0_10_44_11]|nr:MAG: 50S ribosomal protein L15 [Candidatus Pacebacteria bacterium CG10_big_fil_rev_8_21_14_0_10_44_11]
MSILSSLPRLSQKPKKRVGRGYGSQKGGHTAGRGQKGQGSRRGFHSPLWFEGGQLPLIKRLPMLRGKARFNVLTLTAEVSLADLNKMKAEVITLDTLKLEKVIPARSKQAKVIASGSVNKKITLEGIKVSAQAKQAIEKAGGKIK